MKLSDFTLEKIWARPGKASYVCESKRFSLYNRNGYTELMTLSLLDKEIKSLCKELNIEIVKLDYHGPNAWRFHKVEYDWESYNANVVAIMEEQRLLYLEDDLEKIKTEDLKIILERRIVKQNQV